MSGAARARVDRWTTMPWDHARERARLSSMPAMTWINAAIMCGTLI
jgi:hypothetical protein